MRGDLEGAGPLLGLRVDEQAEGEHVGVGAVEGRDVLQLVVRRAPVAQREPTLGGVEVAAVGGGEGVHGRRQKLDNLLLTRHEALKL